MNLATVGKLTNFVPGVCSFLSHTFVSSCRSEMDDFLKLNNHTTPSSGGGSDSDEEPWRFKPIHALLFAGVIGGIGGIIWGIVKLRNWLYDRKEDRRRRRDPEFTKASEAMVIL